MLSMALALTEQCKRSSKKGKRAALAHERLTICSNA